MTALDITAEQHTTEARPTGRHEESVRIPDRRFQLDTTLSWEEGDVED